MDVLKDYPEEFAQTFQTSFRFLFAINIRFWFHDVGFLTRYWRFLYIGPCALLFATSASVDVALMLRDGRIVEIAYRLPPFLIMIQGLLKGLVLLPRTRDIARLIRQLGALWRGALGADQRALRTKLLRRIRLYNKATYWFALVGTSQYLLTPLAQTLAQTMAGGAGGRLLPMAARYPFDPAAPAAPWPLYIAVYTFQFYSMFLCMLSYIGAELLMLSACALLAAEFALLRTDLLRQTPAGIDLLRQTPAGSDLQRHSPAGIDLLRQTPAGCDHLVDIVRRHQELLRLSEQFDNIFNKLVFVDLMFVGGTTCFFRFAGQFSRGAADMLNNYIGVVSSQLYVLCVCYYGEQLSGASLSVADAAYDSPWYKANKEYRTIIFMNNKRALRPSCLTSLRYARVSLNMFTKVMSTTWSYFSLMTSVYEEDE